MQKPWQLPVFWGAFFQVAVCTRQFPPVFTLPRNPTDDGGKRDSTRRARRSPLPPPGSPRRRRTCTTSTAPPPESNLGIINTVLPAGWFSGADPQSGSVLYFNEDLQMIQYALPTQAQMGAIDAAPLAKMPPGWWMKIDEATGNTYYFNVTLAVTQLVRPV